MNKYGMPNKFTPSNPFNLYQDNENFPSKDSIIFDSVVKSHIDIGGTVVYVYRYMGTPPQERNNQNARTFPFISNGVTVQSFLNIQDPLLGENRDRNYNFDDVPRLRAAYKVTQTDLLFGQFGPQGMANDVMTLEFHLGTVKELLDRTLIVGDVVEFPHLKEISVDGSVTKKFYEVVRVMRAPTGWSPVYSNHLQSVMVKAVRDSQEFIQFMEQKDKYGKTLRDQVSPASNLIALNDAISEEVSTLASNHQVWDDRRYYFDPTNKCLRPYMFTQDGAPPNGIPVQQGNFFPLQPKEFDYFVRNDLYPNRLYQFYDNRWHIKEEDRSFSWTNYAWVEKFQEFVSTSGGDNKFDPNLRLVSIHDVFTDRENSSDPTQTNTQTEQHENYPENT